MKIIELLKYIFLSIIQGVGEILPISSSGHLVLFRKILKLNIEGMEVELILHLASIFALFIFYRKTIGELLKGMYFYLVKKDKNYKKEVICIRGMIISLMPTCLIGYFANDYLNYFLKYSFLIGFFLILNGLNLLMVKDKYGNKSIEELSLFSFFKIGLGQCLGLVPGISRSGVTLSMCYREKMSKEDSEMFTFLMLFPLVAGSLLLNINGFSFDYNLTVLIAISFIVTFLVTLLSLNLLSSIVRKGKLYYFSYYCIIIGVVVMMFL